MNERTWFDEEARAADFIRQGAVLFVRGIRRPWRTLAIALLVALAVAGALALTRSSYAPRLVLRVVEGDGDASTQAHLKRRLADYVREGIFTSEPLLALIRRHGLYPTLVRNNPQAALESFREDINVEVYQNYFVEEREPGMSPRSARVAVGYRAAERSTALAVTRDLGGLISEHEILVRREQAARAANEAGRTRDALRVELERRTQDVATKRSEIAEARSPNPESQVKLVGLMGSLAGLERDLDGATHRAASFELGAALEQGGVGLRFEVADEASLPNGAARVRFIALAALTTFIMALPLAATAVGAFTQRSKA